MHAHMLDTLTTPMKIQIEKYNPDRKILTYVVASRPSPNNNTPETCEELSDSNM